MKEVGKEKGGQEETPVHYAAACQPKRPTPQERTFLAELHIKDVELGLINVWADKSNSTKLNYVKNLLKVRPKN